MSIWNFLNEMEELHSQLSEFNKANSFDNHFRGMFMPGLSARHFPMMNLAADEDKLTVEALAPGLDVESLKVSALRNTLTISGEKAELADENVTIHRKERAAGKFTRTIELPVAIDPDKVEASYIDGILKITLPKAEEAKPRQISIKIN